MRLSLKYGPGLRKTDLRTPDFSYLKHGPGLQKKTMSKIRTRTPKKILLLKHGLRIFSLRLNYGLRTQIYKCISGTVFPKILTKKQKNILSLVLELKDFNFVNLIQEKDLVVSPENMHNGVLHIDFEVFRNCFSSDAFEMLQLNLEEKKNC